MVLLFLVQDKRMSVMDALVHPYIDEGRLRYHSCMCKCCFTVPLTGLRHFCMDYEPVAPQTFDDKWEKKMSNVQQVKGLRRFKYLPIPSNGVKFSTITLHNKVITRARNLCTKKFLNMRAIMHLK